MSPCVSGPFSVCARGTTERAAHSSAHQGFPFTIPLKVTPEWGGNNPVLVFHVLLRLTCEPNQVLPSISLEEPPPRTRVSYDRGVSLKKVAMGGSSLSVLDLCLLDSLGLNPKLTTSIIQPPFTILIPPPISFILQLPTSNNLLQLLASSSHTSKVGARPSTLPA